jgi:hypothetical protein
LTCTDTPVCGPGLENFRLPCTIKRAPGSSFTMGRSTFVVAPALVAVLVTSPLLVKTPAPEVEMP